MIWFSTWNGLNRYDGYQFESFKSRVGDGVDVPSDRIMDMVLDDDGNLLCNIEGGVFVFDVNSEAGVNDIVVDEANAPVEYYNLQGVRVANPENGLYIRVQGKKATKVLVK